MFTVRLGSFLEAIRSYLDNPSFRSRIYIVESGAGFILYMLNPWQRHSTYNYAVDSMHQGNENNTVKCWDNLQSMVKDCSPLFDEQVNEHNSGQLQFVWVIILSFLRV